MTIYPNAKHTKILLLSTIITNIYNYNQIVN